MDQKKASALALFIASLVASLPIFFLSTIQSMVPHHAEKFPVGVVLPPAIVGLVAASFLIVSIITRSRSGWVLAWIALVISIIAVGVYARNQNEAESFAQYM